MFLIVFEITYIDNVFTILPNYKFQTLLLCTAIVATLTTKVLCCLFPLLVLVTCIISL